MEALAICESNGVVMILCPHGSHTHEHPSGTGRLNIALPAPCNETLSYTIGATMKPKSLVSAMKGYNYSLEKKRKARLSKKFQASLSD